MDNINSPLYICDSLAMELCGKDYELRELIRNHLKRRETTITTPTEISESVSDYLNNEVIRNEAQIRVAQAELKRKFNESIQPTEEELNAITLKIQKRKAHRLPQYGFQLTTTGWKNIDKGIIPKDWSHATPEIIASGSDEFMVVRSYLIFPEEKSLVQLDAISGVSFTSKSPIPVKHKYTFIAAAIAFNKEEELFFDFKRVDFNDLTESIRLNLSEATEQEINYHVTEYANWNDENNIGNELSITDLERRIYTAKHKRLEDELDRTPILFSAFSPVLDYESGKTLFANNCATCHSVDGSVLAGPGLNGITNRWPLQEIALFTKNPKLTCELGFENAIESAQKWSPVFGWMQASELTESEILSILLYIDEYAVYSGVD